MSEPRTEQEVQQELAFLRNRIRVLSRGRFQDAQEDVTSDAWIRLDRALRREDARNKEALMTSIAWRAWVDFASKERTAGRYQGPLDPDEAGADPLADDGDCGVDPELLEIWAFAAMAWFAREQPRCVDPLRGKLAGLSWPEVATTLNEAPNALAKRWQRCKDAYLEHVRADHGDLAQILEYLEHLST